MESIAELQKPPFDKPIGFVKLFDAKTRAALMTTINKIKEYLDDAFTEDTSLSIYNLRENIKKDFVITMVNSYKAEYLRCGTVIEAGDGYIDV